MNRRHRMWLAWGLLAAVVLALGAGALAPPATPQAQARLNGLGAGQGSFARADGPRPFSFPADQGPHNDFQTEWWYYTGNLTTPDGRPFGFQLTFFRRALQGPTERAARASQWATDQV